MKKINCEVCGEKVIDFLLVRIVHFLWEVTCMVIFFIKLLFWLSYQTVQPYRINGFPCKCKHTVFWHLIAFDLEDPDPYPSTMLKQVLAVKFILLKDQRPRDCMRCFFSFIIFSIKNIRNEKVIYPFDDCKEFRPVSNLTYLEDKYVKKNK